MESTNSFIITEKGEVVEGQPISQAEAEAIPVIMDKIYSVSSDYVSIQNRKKIMLALLADYVILPRVPEPVAQTPVEINDHAAFLD